jgi:hypothetical protein
MGPVEAAGEGARISTASARLLGIETGQTICFSPLRPTAPPAASAPVPEAKP